MIQRQLAQAVRDAIARAQADGSIPQFDVPAFEMERPNVAEHGDWATTVSLALAKAAQMPPRKVAEAIVRALGDVEHVAAIEIAGPGFINFRLTHAWLTGIVRDVEAAGERWGHSQHPEPEKIQVEFVSANPNGPMHLGHGRWAALGDTIARLLEATGSTVEREFYVNDFGMQMMKFAQSIDVRYREIHGHPGEIPEGGYNGEYVREIAAKIVAEVGDRYLDASEEDRLPYFRAEGQRLMLESQRNTLERFGVAFNVWFSESTLHEGGAVRKVVEVLTELGHTYDKDGATWLRTTDFGDDKDRVLVRSTDGMPAYIAADIAYFMDKIRRGFGKLIYLIGADHHGWVREIAAAISALGEDPQHCEFLIGQWVRAVRGGKEVALSKRKGESITFDELLDEVGVDAARYHYLRTSMDQSLTLDLDFIVSQSQENPVYYVQYAHARICSIMRNAEEQGVAIGPVESTSLDELQHDSEFELLRKIAEFPEAMDVAARLRAPHRITRFAEELAALFHSFYRDCRVLTDDAALSQARLHLCRAAEVTLRNALMVLGVSAPERM